MDLAQYPSAYQRAAFMSNGNGTEVAQREAAEDEMPLAHHHQQPQFSTPFHFGVEATPSPQVEGIPFNSLSANLFSQQSAATRSSGSSSKEEVRNENEEMLRVYQQDQELRRHLAQPESWQGDWSAVAPALDCPTSAGMVPMAKPSLDLLSSSGPLQPLMTPTEDRRKLEMNSQGLLEPATSAPHLIDPFAVKHGLPPMPMTAGGLLTSRNLEHYASIPFPDAYSAADNLNHSFAAAANNDSVHRLKAVESSNLQCPPHSAPPTMHAYPPSAVLPPKVPENSVFTFRPEHGTGEVGWIVEDQTSRFQSTPLLNGKVKFPTRPLMPGVLAKIHNDWLDDYPEIAPETERGGNRAAQPTTKRFPTPQMTFESQHVRTLWQELERRRILEVTDGEHLHRLRQEAMHLMKIDTAYRLTAGLPNGLSQEELFDSIPDPPEDQVNEKAWILWEQTRKAAIYAVGLLRQAEYCIAQAHLGFMPLNHHRGAQHLHQQQQQQMQQIQHQQQQQQAEASRSASTQRTQMMAAFIPDPQAETNIPAASRLRSNAKYTEHETTV